MEEEINNNIQSTPKKNIRKCPHCNQDMEVQLGLSKKNIKKLFKKPTMDQWITLFIMFLAVSSFLIYRYEINATNTYIKENCTCTNDYSQGNNFKINFTNIESVTIEEYDDTKNSKENS